MGRNEALFQIVKFLLIVFLMLLPDLVQAEFLSAGHLKLQATGFLTKSDSVDRTLGPDALHQETFDFRSNNFASFENWQFNAEFEALALSGTGLETRRASLAGSPFAGRVLPEDARQLLDLTFEVADEPLFSSVIRADRLSAAYKAGPVYLKAGRQAVSWGNSLLFPVFDVFNPFSPTEIDRDYKQGSDMLYGQFLLPGGADIQTILVPRRRQARGLQADRSSLATKLYVPIHELGFDFELLAGAHFGQSILGAGFTQSIFGGVLRGSATLSKRLEQDTALSASLNIDRSWELFSKNVYAYLEYFHSDFGEQEESYMSPSLDLLDRLDRGEQFTFGRDYLAFGTNVEVSPLSSWFTSVILNLRDESGIVQQRLEYEWTESFETFLGVDFPFGSKGTEFGGLAAPQLPGQAPTGLFFRPSTVAYLRAAFYF